MLFRSGKEADMAKARRWMFIDRSRGPTSERERCMKIAHLVNSTISVLCLARI